MPEELSKVWLITGCSSGLGRAIALQALTAGHRVVATARSMETLHEMREAYPTTCLTLRLDVLHPAEMDEAIKAAIELWGRIDVLVNNAGYGQLGPLESIPCEEMRSLFEVNFFGAVQITQKVLPLMRAQNSGHVIFISAAAAIANYAGFSSYGASKAALESVGEALALEARSFGVKVTMVQPGPFRTNFISSSLERTAVDDPAYAGSVGKFGSVLEKMAGRQPGDPAKAAQAILAVVETSNPPLRLALGKYATDKTEKTLNSRLRDNETWKHVGLATEFS
jgi:NAD(P)-dependent dehydrogenase (short-subunit alcohol dehydrogenase family)